MSGASKIGLEKRDGYKVGRDPREMSHDELRQMGHKPMSALKAMRLKCLDCCNFSPNEVRLCVAVDCPNWPFRLGKSPWRSPMSAEAKAKLAANFGPNIGPVAIGSQKTGGQNTASGSDGGLPPNDTGGDLLPKKLTVNPEGAK